MEVYEQGLQAYRNEAYGEARSLLELARDMDGVRFRASTEVNTLIRELGEAHGNTLVPMLEVFREHAPHGIVGRELMTEHVHPNVNGAFLMADAFFREIRHSRILGAEEAAPYSLQYYMRNWGYTELDTLLAHHRVANLATHWPFRPADAPLEDYRLRYRPQGLKDSLAFTAMSDPDLTLEDLRLDLARNYEEAGEHWAAYREFESLLRNNPYVAVNYRDAASSLIMLGHLPQALEYYLRSLEIEASFFASYRVGEIYLIKGDHGRARAYFQQAFGEAGNDQDRLKALGKLYQACVYAGDVEDARALAKQLQGYQAEQFLRIPSPVYTYTRYVPYKTRSQVEEARALMDAGAFLEAIPVLEASLEHYDSHMAHRYLGECYRHTGDLDRALYHLRRVEDEFAHDTSFTRLLTRE
jgi:tetratricopeptide (TPR) repeat protein